MHADMVDLELSSDLIGKQCCVDDLNCLIIRVGRFLLYRGYYVQYTSYWTYIVIGTMAFCPHHGGFCNRGVRCQGFHRSYTYRSKNMHTA